MSKQIKKPKTEGPKPKAVFTMTANEFYRRAKEIAGNRYFTIRMGVTDYSYLNRGPGSGPDRKIEYEMYVGNLATGKWHVSEDPEALLNEVREYIKHNE